MFLTLYVDEILLDGNNLEIINATEQWMSSIFEMKDMGEARYVLGVEIVRNYPKKLSGMCPLCICQENNKEDYVPYLIC